MPGQLHLEEVLPTFQSLDDWSIMPNSFTINKTKPTNKVIFVSLDCNVDTNQFPLELQQGFDKERFTIARETRDKRRVEKTGLNNFFNIREVTKLDEGIIFLWDKVLFDCGEELQELDSSVRVFLER